MKAGAARPFRQPLAHTTRRSQLPHPRSNAASRGTPPGSHHGGRCLVRARCTGMAPEALLPGSGAIDAPRSRITDGRAEVIRTRPRRYESRRRHPEGAPAPPPASASAGAARFRVVRCRPLPRRPVLPLREDLRHGGGYPMSRAGPPPAGPHSAGTPASLARASRPLVPAALCDGEIEIPRPLRGLVMTGGHARDDRWARSG